MSIKLTPAQSREVNRLVKNHCCNLWDGNCLILDDGDTHACVQLISFSGIFCNYFAKAMLPNNPQLEAEIMQPQNCKQCVVCGDAFMPASNRQKYCPVCSSAQERRKDAERKRRKRAMQCPDLGA